MVPLDTGTPGASRENDFDVIPGQVVLCRKLRWICRKHSNDVARQVETQSKRTIFVSRDKFILSRDITFMSRRWLRYTMTAKQVNVAIDLFLVCLPVKYCDILHSSGIFLTLIHENLCLITF